MVLHRYILLITTCNILYFVFSFTCVPVRPHSGCTRDAPAAPRTQCLHASRRTYVILHAQTIYGMMWVSCVKALWCHFWSGDVTSGLMTSHPWQINTTWLWTVWGSHMSTI